MVNKHLSIKFYKYLWHSILVLLLLLNTTIHSQVRFSSLETLDINKGLSQNSINSIYQDKEGFMWFCTMDGLNSYDGKKFNIFRPDPFDSASIGNLRVICINEDLIGNLYVGTREGLFVYHKQMSFFTETKTDSVHNFFSGSSINTILCDSIGNMWIGTDRGLAIFNPSKQCFLDLKGSLLEKERLTKTIIWTLFMDKKMDIWISTYSDGTYRYSNSRIEHFTSKHDDRNTLSNKLVNAIIEDSRGHLWFATYNGLSRYEPETKKFDRYFYFKDQSNPINYLNVSSIIETSKGDILVGIEDYGLYKYNRLKNSFEPFNLIDEESGKLSGISYLSLFEDRSGGLWFGTKSEGIRKINLYEKQFINYNHQKGKYNSLIDNNVYSLYETSDGKVWVGTLQGITIWDRKNNSFSHLVQEHNKKNTLCDNRIWSITQDHNGYFWIGTSHGVNRYDSKSKLFKYYFTDYSSKNQISDNEVYTITEDFQGNIWFGTYWGLSKLNPLTETFTNYHFSLKDSTSIANDNIWVVFEDSRKNLWFGTQNGLSKYIPDKDCFKNYRSNPKIMGRISGNEIQSITEDRSGNLWIGTTFGLNCFNPQTEQFESITMRSGLPNNTVYGVLFHNDDIWFSTNKGIVNINKKNDHLRVFDYSDGIQSNEFNFPSLKTKDGLLVFGGVNGITTFYSDSIKMSQTFPPIVFTDFKINFKSIRPQETISDVIPLEKAINHVDKVTLSYKEKAFSIDFASLNYISTNKIKYKYRIDEITDWIDIGNQSNISFTGLNHGRYTFRLKGTNSDGFWSDKEKVLTLIILPPWWKTRIFLAFVIIAILLLIFFVIKYREASLRKEKRVLEEMVRKRTKDIENQNEEILSQKERIEEQNIQLEKHSETLEALVEIRTADLKRAKEKAEESDKLKSSFLANISHEVRTPLNAIVGFSGFLTSDKISKEDIKQYVDIIKTNSDNLIDIITDIIDIAKIESDQLDVYLTRCDIYKLMNEVYLSFKEIVESKKQGLVQLYYQPDLSQESLVIKTDSFRVKQVLTNLLKNAVKYTELGTIGLGFSVKDQTIEFWVFDTGIGIPFEAQAYIFERFRKIERENEQLYSGTGLGLAISKNLVELLGGKIRFESIPNQGSRFYFTIPLV